MGDHEHEARRFRQIAELERELQEVQRNISVAKEHVKDLKAQAEGLVQAIRAAARDEGELPLLDMMEDAGGSVQ